MSEPIPVRVTRYRCPHCARSHSSKYRCRLHIGRCWQNQDAKGCMTCRHFLPGDSADYATGYPGSEESCQRLVSLDGRPQCETCIGEGVVWVGDEPNAQRLTCPDCNGRPDAVKPGPIVHCPLWELSPDFEPSSPRS